MPKPKSTKVSKHKENVKDEDTDSSSENAIEEENEENEENEDKIIEINQHLYKSIKDTFDLELKKIFRNIARKYGEEYFFNQEDLLNFYKQLTVEFKYKTAESSETDVKNQSKIPTAKKSISSEERCLARVWAGGHMIRNSTSEQYGDQCQRKKFDGKLFCKQHIEHLVHGRFDEEPSKIVKGFFIKHNDKSYNKE
jgi:hypothetical protein